jgi:hypothetical protein
MFDGYNIDKFTKDMLDEAVKKDKLEFLKNDYLIDHIKEIYTNNGIVRIEVLGNSRYNVIEIIYCLNWMMAEIMSKETGVKVHFTKINKIIVTVGTNPNSFIIESNENGRFYDYMPRETSKLKIDIALEVIGSKRHTEKADSYLTIVYDRRYTRKGVLDIAGFMIDEAHYTISDEVAYACLPANHNSTRY